MGVDPYCEYCEHLACTSSADDEDLSQDGNQGLFHGSCTSCASLDESKGPLCAFCQHLRVRHLLFCPDEASWCTVDLGTLSQAKARLDSGCCFCSLIGFTIDSYVSLHQPISSQITFTLEFFKADHQQPDPAKIGISVYDDGDDEVVFNSWALHAYLTGAKDQEPTSRRMLEDPLWAVNPLIQWRRIKNWILSCEKNHKECAPSGQSNLPPGFRVIDIVKRQLVQPKGQCRFVALSYVWGRNPDPSKLMTRMSNVRELEEEGALHPSVLPTTIAEAMHACELIGERYLWADRLCIVQDDPINKRQQIESMVDIYSQAAFAMVIASSSSVDDPVPGIANPRTYSTKVATFDGIQVLTVLPSFAETVIPSVWASRGWTYQEAVLARRKLYFTPRQMIFECEEGHVYEDNLLNQDPWRDCDVACGGGFQERMPHLERPSASSRSSFEIYDSHVGAYNSRSLTYVSDIYNGFAGVLGALYDNPDACYFGLPLADLGQALLWYPDTDISPSQEKPSSPRVSNDVLMPSWSWSSVSGPISHLSTGAFCGSVCTWASAVVGPQGLFLKPVDDTNSLKQYWNEVHELEGESIVNRWLRQAPQISMAIAAEEGCFRIRHSPGSSFWNQKSFLETGQELFKRWPDFGTFQRDVEVVPPQDHGVKIRAGMLAAQVQATTLKIALHEPHDAGSSWNCRRAGTWLEIRDDSDKRIGMLAPFPTSPSYLPKDSSKRIRMEFIGLSVSTRPNTNISLDVICVIPELSDELLGIPTSLVHDKIRDLRDLELTYRDVDSEPLWPAPVMNVMMIERCGAVCRRVSVGWVLLRRWSQVACRWEKILLT